jgi:hypothetical protein
MLACRRQLTLRLGDKTMLMGRAIQVRELAAPQARNWPGCCRLGLSAAVGPPRPRCLLRASEVQRRAHLEPGP